MVATILFNQINLNLLPLIIIFLILFFIAVYLFLPWIFKIFVSPRFNASYIYRSKDFKKKELDVPLNKKDNFQIDFDNKSGLYSISFGKNRKFLDGNIKIRYQLRDYSICKTKSKSLKLISCAEIDGNDRLGAFKSINAEFRLKDEDLFFEISIKNYIQEKFIIFELNVPKGLENDFSDKKSKLITSFPSFINKSPHTKILTFRNTKFCPPSRKFDSTSAPVLLYDVDLNCFTLCPLDGFLNTLISKDKHNRINCGIQGEIKELPKNFSQKFILLFSKGINHSLEHLGDILLKFHDSKRKNLYANVVTSYLGYWTDNGGYYYYKTEKGMNYEDTMMVIKEYFVKNNIPIKYYNFDSWWYLKHTNKFFTTLFRFIVRLAGGGLYGNTLLWEVDPTNFTTNLKTFHRKFQIPITAHNRRWDSRSPYVDKYKFETYKNHAVPLKKEFWQWLMTHARESGIVVYEQDWIKNQIASMPILRQKFNAQENWLNNMATAAKENEIDVFYCMQTPGILLYSIKHSNVNISRCSEDYNHRWPLTYRYVHSTQTNILFNAVGINSHPDVFRSRTIENVRLRPFGEKYPNFKCLYQILNGGVVAPGDKKENVNWALLKRTCRDDGLLLKPDKSLTVNDLMFKKHRKYYICDTYTKINHLTWSYIVITNIWPRRVKETSFTLRDLGFEMGDYIIYDYFSDTLSRINFDKKIEIGRLKRYGYKYYIISPLTKNEMALIGCPDKFITCSRKLIININTDERSIKFSVQNIKGAKVKLLFYSEKRPTKIQIDNELSNTWNYIKELSRLEVNIRFDKDSRKEILIQNMI
ncbi:MAG: hypothetical protein ACFFA2_05200 [Promethearchaeota archaeon]